MLELDGNDAGGQFLRSALTLAAVDDRPIRIENIRGNRSTPGLRPQHLAVVETLASICDAAVSGDESGSETVTFEPKLGSDEAQSDGDRAGEVGTTVSDASGEAGTDVAGTGDTPIPGGTFAVDIRTAGSLTLLFDAILPLATRLDSPLTLTATGGTDVTWSPLLDYYRHVKVALLRRYGLQAALEVDRRGFYPAGGGKVTVRLAPSTMSEIRLDERSPLREIRLYSTESASLADRNVSDRQLAAAVNRLESAVDAGELEVDSDANGPIITERVRTTAESDSPGSAIACRLDFANAIAGTGALGEKGKPAERVGEDAANAAIRLLEGSAPVDSHLADQLLIWLALAGGCVRVPSVTDHVETSLALLGAFGHELRCDRVKPSADADHSTDERDEHVISAE